MVYNNGSDLNMAITTDRHITIHGVSVGVSKPIQTLISNGDFTFVELSKYAIVGRHDFVNDVAGVFEPDTYSYTAGTSAAISELEKYPVLNSPTAPGWDSVLYTYFGAGHRLYENYGKMVLVYNMVSSNNTIDKNFNDNNEACIVTELNPRLIKMLGTLYTSNITANAGDTGSHTVYDAEASRSFVWVDDDTTAPFSTMCIQNFDDAYYFDFPLYNNIFNATENISGNRDSTYVSLQNVFDDYMLTGSKILSVWCNGGIDDFLVGANYGGSFTGVHNLSDERGDKIICVNYANYGAECTIKASSLDTALKQLAGCGFYFEVNGTVYKPITTGGVVTGYTADLTKNSEWDLINDVTGNTIPDTPSGGGGDANGDELTDMLSRGQFYGSGLTKYYVDVPAAKLQKALGDWDNIETGKDVLQNLLSYKILVFPSTTFSNGMTEPFVIAGTELKDESDNTITAKKLTSTGAVNLPSIKITPTFNDFRDYAPYTKIQMFVPLCGWFDLPPWCMGRTISGEMYINPYSGTCRCLVRADGNVVAELGGNAAIDLPFNATAVGMKSAAVLSNLIQTAGAVGRAVMLPTVNTLAGAGSAALGAICAMNANYTESKGTMGDGSNVYGLYHVFIKITRPATVDNAGNSLVIIPSQYCHDYGRPCNKQLTLTAGDGYTQIMDAKITGAMTDREKQMIIDGFRHGLIL